MLHTKLFSVHEAENAKFIEFCGWQMPVQFQSVIKEHLSVREDCGVFDASHMGKFFLTGADAFPFINYITTNDLFKISEGGALYTLMLNQNGGCVDDLLVYQLTKNKFLFVVNASNLKKDFDWIKAHLESSKYDLEIKDKSTEYSILAIQGPKSASYLSAILNEKINIPSFGVDYKNYHDHTIIIARTGYTGEDGFEILIPNEIINNFYKNCLDQNITPCGLGARDSLRLEKGFSLYGHELTEDTNPIEAGLSWAISNQKDFIGKKALETFKAKRKIRGFILEESGLAREGCEVYDQNQNKIGYVTSSTYSPCLKKCIGLCFIPIDYLQNEVYIKIRNAYKKANLHKRKFL